MIIQSRFKDYYDYLSHQYGAEPGLVYVRDRLVSLDPPQKPVYGGKGWAKRYKETQEKEQERLSKLSVTGVELRKFTPWLESTYKDCGAKYPYRFKWIAICGKYYMIVGTPNRNEFPQQFGEFHYEASTWAVATKENFPDLYNGVTKVVHGIKKVSRAVGHFDESYFVGDTDPRLDVIARSLRAPVFAFDENQWRGAVKEPTVYVEADIPVLKDLGIPSVLPAETLYQELSMYLANVIRETPDRRPPVEVDPKNRLVQHGFDPKVSFRPNLREKLLEGKKQ